MKRIVLTTNILFIVVLVILFTTPQFVHAGWGWLIYHERSFKGKVIDAETKEPIEGAVVIAQYNVNMLGPTGSHTTLTDVQEALTDKNGDFFIRPITKFIHPLSVGYKTFFLIWKPGYKKEEIKDAYFFTKEPGTFEDLPVQTDKGFEMRPVRLGIVELEMMKTEEERRKAIPTRIGEFSDFKKQKQFIRFINEERKLFGFEPFETED